MSIFSPREKGFLDEISITHFFEPRSRNNILAIDSLERNSGNSLSLRAVFVGRVEN